MGGSWFTVNREIPCPVCEKSSRCRVTPNREDPMVVSCYHKDTHLGKAAFKSNDGAAGTSYLHRLKDPPGWENRPRKRRSAKRAAVPGVVRILSESESMASMDDFASREPVEPVEPQNMELRHRVYLRLLELCPVSFDHITENATRGIDAKNLGYGTLPNKSWQKKAIAQLIGQFTSEALLTVPGFVEKEPGEISINSGAGLLVPCRNRIGEIVRIVRRDPNPLKKDNKWRPLSGGTHHDGTGAASAGVTLHWARLPGAGVVIVTEGERKADSIAAVTDEDMGVVSVPGVGSWRSAGLIEELELLGVRRARIAYDSDVFSNIAVGRAALQAATALGDASIKVEFAVWDPAHKGMDDALAAKAEIRTLSGDDALAHREAIAAKHGLRLDGQKLPDSRPVINVDLDDDLVLEQALALLANDDRLFLKGGKLVQILPVGAKSLDNQTALGPVCLAGVDSSLVAARLAQLARWTDDKGGISGVPRWLADRVVSCAGGMGFAGPRSIEGILSGPTIDEKGNLINSAGYYLIGGQGWYAAGSVLGLEIPDAPTFAECQAAEEVIRCVVQYFPWKVPLDYHKWLAGLLAAVTRPLVDATPMMLITAHSAGSGKSTLCRIITLILRGREPDNLDWPGDVRNRDEELRKLFSGLIQGGETLAFFDNLPDGETMTSPSLCNLLTARYYKARRLGGNDGINSGGVNRLFVWATGNNVTPGADLADRSLVVRLESRVANQRSVPFSNYGAIGDVIPYVETHRVKLLSAALTMVKGYIKLGSPPQAGESWGSFSDLLSLPVAIVRWVCGVDPIADRAEVVGDDPVALGAGVLLVGWLRLYEAGEPLTAGRILKDTISQIGENKEAAEFLRDALAALGRGDTVQGIGRILQRIVARRIVCDGKTYYLTKRADNHSKSTEYSFVHDIPRTPFAGIAGIAGDFVGHPAYEGEENILFEELLESSRPAKTSAIPAIPAAQGLKFVSHLTEFSHTAKKNLDLVETDAAGGANIQPPVNLFGSSAEGPYAYGA